MKLGPGVILLSFFASFPSVSIGEDEMLPTVMQEFPFLHVSPQTAHDMWAKQMRQMEQLTKMGIDQQYKKTKTQLKVKAIPQALNPQAEPLPHGPIS